jgi:prefoldin subunit 5
MEKSEFLDKTKEELEMAIMRQEFEIGFLDDELGKLEDDINKTSTIVYPSIQDGRKDIGHLRQEKSAIEQIIAKHKNILETLKAKHTFLIETF